MNKSAGIPYYMDKMNEVFLSRKAKNPRYSLRSYAQSLELNPGTLSAILSGKRQIPSDKIKSIIRKLKLSDEDQGRFLTSLFPQSNPTQNSYELNADKYHLLYEDWEYLVILALFRLKDFESSCEWISQKTNITLVRVQECVEFLFSLGLILKNDDGAWERAHASLHSSHNVSSSSIRASHKNTLQLAIEKIDSVPVEERDYTFMTVGLDEKRFNKLRKMILKFRDEVFELDESSKRQKLYRVGIQCFPVTEDKV